MKNIAIATSLLVTILGVGVSQYGCAGTETKTESPATQTKIVLPATIDKMPPGKTFDIDLTRKGTIYNFDGTATDFSRITIQTTKGVRNLADLLRESKTDLKGGVVLGTSHDMRNHLSIRTTSGTNYDCGVFCKCDDTVDCIGMILDGKCAEGTEFWCSDSGSCYCVAK